MFKSGLEGKKVRRFRRKENFEVQRLRTTQGTLNAERWVDLFKFLIHKHISSGHLFRAQCILLHIPNIYCFDYTVFYTYQLSHADGDREFGRIRSLGV